MRRRFAVKQFRHTAGSDRQAIEISSVFEFRFSLFEEGRHALGLVLGAERRLEDHPFEADAFARVLMGLED